MKKPIFLSLLSILPFFLSAQDLSEGLIINDLSLHPMQDISKPEYLDTIIDPSFGTTIRRITNANTGEVIVPMYSTIQAWNADESFMILYNQSIGQHELLDGITYEFHRILDDVTPADLEQIFWDFNDPNIFYYLEYQTDDFIKYSVDTQSKETLINLQSVVNCGGSFQMGNDIQMMSWDSDIFTFRCDNETAYSYQLSTGTLTTFDIDQLQYNAPGVAPSGNRYYHSASVYDNIGNNTNNLNLSSIEHSCIGKLSNGNDAYFAIAFAQGPQGGCIGDIIAHDLTTGNCFPIISQSQGYEYPQSGTHISALAHKNTEGGWIAASMMGYDQDGQTLLDQELVIVKAEEGNIKVCRIGHHRSDEDQFDYWGEPHAVISPTGTRVLFASDWSGSEDGQSVDSYIVELPTFSNTMSSVKTSLEKNEFCKIYPNPITDHTVIKFYNPNKKKMGIQIYSLTGEKLISDQTNSDEFIIRSEKLSAGIYLFNITDSSNIYHQGKFIKQ